MHTVQAAEKGLALFRIKICGVTSIQDANLVAESGADAIGLNFVDDSPRCVTIETARQLAAVVGDRLTKVGVFVNRPVEEVNRIAAAVNLDMVQLHGDESTEACSQVVGPVVKALAFGPQGLAPLLQFWEACQQLERPLAGLLIDASVPGRYGGTGSTIDWSRLATCRDQLDRVPWALAGGLCPGNVARAIATVAPSGVDVASGVESSPGTKDRIKTSAFVSAAKTAWGLG
jgi:phosphoribosylanthranilate isomerase